ncbi:unnamed protein product [Arabidopsis lyrata]|uniref:Uncharacterized protein n=1 Tax=Arabidopsis suecica TaxID=45249 RepID=A0A8T2FJC6_ARASU|nr:hypothetical protein ISN44_As03g051390 [Arabidopsis suecica]CAH8269166.1 unnamed protein product [Arabidopsis lyrata]
MAIEKRTMIASFIIVLMMVTMIATNVEARNHVKIKPPANPKFFFF